MNARSFQLSAAAAACLAAGSAATADQLTFELQTDTQDRFQFSVLHNATSNPGPGGSGNQSGAILADLTGTFTVDIDRTNKTIQFLSVDFLLDNRSNGSGVDGSIGLATGIQGVTNELNFGVPNTTGDSSGDNTGGGELLAGKLALNVDGDGDGFDINDGTDGTLVFDFVAFEFNELANQFFDGDSPFDGNDDPFGIGLWDATENTDAIGFSTPPEDIGIDLYGTAIPLPHPGALAGLGLLGVIGVRRLRRA